MQAHGGGPPVICAGVHPRAVMELLGHSQILRSKHRPTGVRNGKQHPIASRMSPEIVDRLEPVDVQEGHDQRLAGPTCPGNITVEFDDAVRSEVGAGETVE